MQSVSRLKNTDALLDTDATAVLGIIPLTCLD